MPSDKDISKTVELYQAAAKDNPNVDVAALMVNALAAEHKNLVPASNKKWAYSISVGLPPLGILFAFKYFFSTEDDAKQVAYTCLALTILSLLLIWGTSKLFSSPSSQLPTSGQIQQIDLGEIRQLTQ